MDLIDRDAYKQELEKAINRCLNAVGRPDPVVLMALQYAVEKLDSAPVVEAVPIELLYDLAEKKENEKDIKLSSMIKGVVALWHREQENQNESK